MLSMKLRLKNNSNYYLRIMIIGFLTSLLVITSNFPQILLKPIDKNLNQSEINDISIIDTMKIHLLNSDKNLQKLSYDLLQLYDKQYLPAGMTQEEYTNTLVTSKQFVPNQTYTLLTDKVTQGKVYVYIYFNQESEISAANNFVIEITDVDEKNKMIVAWVEVNRLPEITSLKEVQSIRTVIPPVLNTGSVTTQGDAIHRTSDVRSIFNKNGTGIKIGVISDGVQNRSSSQATGDLPPDNNGLTVLSAGTGDEGTAMLEIIHDMVPGAQLYFHTYGANTVQFNTAIDNLVAASCNIICDDVGWITEPFFEDGTVASHVKSVLAANNVIYVSSAGNAAYTHYQGNFFPLTGALTQQDFSEGAGNGFPYLYVNLDQNENVRAVLQWDDPFNASNNDYDLYLYRMNSDFTLASSPSASSTVYQTGTQAPLESINFTKSTSGNSNYAILVTKYSGVIKNLEVYIYPGSGAVPYSDNTKAQDAIYGHPAVNDVVAVGAVDQADPTAIESFSSQGPSTIAFPSSEIRQKPNMVGVDFVSITGAGGFPTSFGGTSAAVPHIVSILAQAWSYDLSQSANEVRQLLYDWAVDLGTTGYDNIYGFGRGDALNIFNGALPVELSSFSASIIGSKIKLNWETATEVNNYGFEILRQAHTSTSLSITDWEKIGFVNGNGNSNSPKSYSYEDKNALSGKYSYRLKQIDNDGTFEYSKIVEADLGTPKTFELSRNYPNPFNPSTTIRYSLPKAGNVKLTVYNILGQEVVTLVNEFKEAGVHTVNFNASELNSGLYIYKLHAGSFNQTRKMMLIK
jgi:hypothetical protein